MLERLDGREPLRRIEHYQIADEVQGSLRHFRQQVLESSSGSVGRLLQQIGSVTSADRYQI